MGKKLLMLIAMVFALMPALAQQAPQLQQISSQQSVSTPSDTDLNPSADEQRIKQYDLEINANPNNARAYLNRGLEYQTSAPRTFPMQLLKSH